VGEEMVMMSTTTLVKSPDRDALKALDAARCRLDAATDLLNQATDLRERLWFGFDLDLMVDEVRAFKRACDAYRRGG
jgi:hypothetical protein